MNREGNPRAPLESLAGTRILDLTRYAPGPFCTLVCAALGAEVIKVEAPPKGDPMRVLDPLAFARLNAGKKSVLLDLKSEAGRAGLRALVQTADVLVESFRPGVMDRLGFGYDDVVRLSPSMLYVSISGYGRSGPFASKGGHDVNYMATAGALRDTDAPPVMQVADFAAGGLYAVIGVLALVLERRASGAGRHLDLSMHEGVLSLLPLATGRVGRALSGRLPNYAVYRARDGKALSVGALEPKFWEAFCEAIGRSDLKGRIDDEGAREEVAATISERDRDDWLDVLEEVDACVEPVLMPEQARKHPQAAYRGFDPGSFRLPFGLDRAELAPAPALGAHAVESLTR